MPGARFERLEPERQEAILAAAAAEFAARGYAAASLNRMIERAGSSKGAFYYYFEDKADLFATVVERAVARVFAELEWPPSQELTAETYWDAVGGVTRRSLEQMENDTWYMQILRSFYRLREEPAAREATARVLDLGREVARSFFQRGRELGVVRTDIPLELMVEMHLGADEAGDRWLLRHWEQFSEAEKLELFEARFALLRDMWEAKPRGRT